MAGFVFIQCVLFFWIIQRKASVVLKVFVCLPETFYQVIFSKLVNTRRTRK